MFAKVIQHRLGFLLAVLITAVGLAVVQLAGDPVLWVPSAALLALLMLGMGFAPLLGLNAPHPAAFQVRAGTFTTLPSAHAVLSAGMATVSPVALGALAVQRTHGRPGIGWTQIVVLALLLLGTPVLWSAVLGPFGLFLRPDGVFDRQPLGSIFVPWEAGPVATPTGAGVRLRLTHPELAVRRGFRLGTSIGTGADRGFTAWAINLYATRPDWRPAIGTDDGLRRLLSL